MERIDRYDVCVGCGTEAEPGHTFVRDTFFLVGDVQHGASCCKACHSKGAAYIQQAIRDWAVTDLSATEVVFVDPGSRFDALAPRCDQSVPPRQGPAVEG